MIVTRPRQTESVVPTNLNVQRTLCSLRMWIIAGPFGGERGGLRKYGLTRLSHTKISNTHRSGVESKLLKSGKSYHIGRKYCDIVNHKKVSYDHGEFVVGGFSPDDVVRLVWYPTSALADEW